MNLCSAMLPLLGFCLFAAVPEGGGRGPLARIHAQVCGLHFYSGQMDRQVVAHHFCSHVTEDLMQCVIYDSNRKDAKLIGIEYVLSARAFKALPPEEKKLWHSHLYEVKSGLLTAPDLAEKAEKPLMKAFATTYGKTWHTWQVDRNAQVPLGIPQLMMAFTADGQVQPKLLAERNQLPGATADAKRRQRAGLPDVPTDPEADAWRRAAPLQLELKPQGPAPVIRIPMH